MTPQRLYDIIQSFEVKINPGFTPGFLVPQRFQRLSTTFYSSKIRDFGLEDKIQYYSTHVEEAEAIIRNAHAFVEQFRDKEREELISILVLEKYFRHTKQ